MRLVILLCADLLSDMSAGAFVSQSLDVAENDHEVSRYCIACSCNLLCEYLKTWCTEKICVDLVSSLPSFGSRAFKRLCMEKTFNLAGLTAFRCKVVSDIFGGVFVTFDCVYMAKIHCSTSPVRGTRKLMDEYRSES